MYKTLVGTILLTVLAIGMQAQTIIEYKFRVEGLCGMCKKTIEDTALDQGKAETASWNSKNNILTVEIDEEVTSVTQIKYQLALVGYDNGDFTAPDEVYEAMPLCCQYRPAKETDATETNVTERQEAISLDEIEGYIYGMENGERFPLIGANVSFEGAADQGTTTDLEGHFKLSNTEEQYKMVRISYIGYEDEVIGLEDNYLEVVLADGLQLETVEISFRRKTTSVSFVNTINVESISREELCKAACCNLSESFETNPAVDVSFSDAVTGTKQIQMLGLTGPYVQITRELIPDVRGLNSLYGLNTTPGPWIQSIQLIKGTGSVVNGFESFTGQINVELKKPDRDERLHINGFANNGGRLETNINLRQDVTKNVSTGLLFHGKINQNVHDRNNDGFTDMPLEKDFVIANRWKFNRKKNIEGQINVKYSNLNHEGGAHDHFAGTSEEHDQHWRMNAKTRRLDLWSKTGFIFPERPQMSIGLQLATSFHEYDSEYGNQRYDATEHSIFSNLIFQNIFDNGHIIRTGLTYMRDDIEELVDKASGFYTRTESIPGAYIEYTLKKEGKWSVIPGLRVDHHNNYGAFITPRLHAKYNLSDQSIIRLTAGRAQRTANIFAENINIFASNRIVDIRSVATDPIPYGLEAEVAWNYGINFTQGFRIGEREFVLAVDAYRTEFENQIVVDFENAQRVSFYNLNGSSFSNSFQIKLDYEPIKNLDLRIAYRLFDVQTSYENKLQERPFVSKHRAFINAAYKTKKDWAFDFTLNWKGAQRLPDTQSNPEEYRRLEYSPSYFLGNTQISKRWGNGKFDIYLGSENIFNYQQTDAIIAADDPFGEFFDASIVWAPLFGRNIYAGFRFNLAQAK